MGSKLELGFILALLLSHFVVLAKKEVLIELTPEQCRGPGALTACMAKNSSEFLISLKLNCT